MRGFWMDFFENFADFSSYIVAGDFTFSFRPSVKLRDCFPDKIIAQAFWRFCDFESSDKAVDEFLKFEIFNFPTTFYVFYKLAPKIFIKITNAKTKSPPPAENCTSRLLFSRQIWIRGSE